MGKQKDFRHVHHSSHKKKDKKVDKTSRTSCQENYLKSVEVVIQAELEAAATSKKIPRKVRKELDRYPILAKAAFLGCERIVDSILEAGENINVQVPDGSTPLILAVENGYPGVVQKLLKKGADPKLLRQDGRNALMIAVAKNDNHSFTLLWNYWDKSNFWELNHTDSQGYTVLTIAVELGHAQFSNFLLSLNGVELDKQTTEGKTALMFAVSIGQVNLVQKLLSSGSDFTLEDKNGATAICLAISQNHRDMQELFYECLDSKSRDVYVKKRIELLTRPRAEVSFVTTFYKDVLFRVLLEVRRRFEDSIVLLDKYRVFVGLYKCLDTHAQDTDLLRNGFHLTACIIYDKAEYSRYISEELAEQYISTKFADFTLKVMQNHRLKSMTEIRGAAFLCIQAGTQCRSGKTWLKSNYFQLLPFVKEFKVILSTLTFWAEGESTKAKIMFDRFVEIFTLVEKDIKSCPSVSPETQNTVIEPNTDQESTDKVSAALKTKRNDSTASMGGNWQVVTKSCSKKESKPVANTPVSLGAIRKNYKKKNKKIKLKTKLQNKIAAKKFSQIQNQKFSSDLERIFPNLSSDKQIANICYADALKKNLENEEILKKCQAKEKISLSKDSCAFLANNKIWSKGRIYSLSDIELDYDIERTKTKTTLNSASEEKISNLKSKDNNKLKQGEQQKEGNAYDYWNSSTFNTNLLQSKENKNQILNPNNQNEFPRLAANASNFAIKDSHNKQSKAFRDILAALGIKTDFDQDESKTIMKNKSEMPAKYLCKKEGKEELKNSLSDVILYSDCLKHDCIALKHKEISTLRNTTVDQIKGNTQNGNTEENRTMGKVSKDTNEDLAIDDEYIKIKEKDEKVQHAKTNEQEQHKPSKNIAMQSSNENSSSSDISENSENSNDKDISKIVIKDSYKKSNEINLITSLKRKNPEVYFQDQSLNYCKEEVKEVKEDSLVHLHCTLGCGINLSYLTEHNKLENLYKRNVDKNKIVVLHEIKGRSEVKSAFNKSVDTYGWLSSDLLRNSDGLLLLSSEFRHPKLTSNIPIENVYASSSAYPDMQFERYIEENLQIPKRNLVSRRLPEERNMFGKPRNAFDFVINGEFSKFDPHFHEYKKKLNSTGIQFSLFSAKQIVSEITLGGIQKFIFLYKREILHQGINQRQLSVLYMNTHPRLPKSSVLYPLRKDYTIERKHQRKLHCYHQESSMKENHKHSFGSSKQYKMLREFKSEIGKILSYLSSWSRKTPENHSRLLRKKSTKETNDIKKMKETNKELTIPKDKKITKTSFTFISDTYGYKSNFINCERRSRWYEKLHRIESCIPLGAFFLQFGNTINTECFLHEIIYGTGKVVFSSKEEHILRQGEFGTYMGLMNNGNPAVVKIFQKTECKNFELLSNKRHINHKNIVSFYCLCNPPNDQRIFAVTELVEYSLPEYIKMRMIHLDKKHLIYDLVEAIQYLHRLRIVHGHLKPTNVMITADDRLKVSDFYQLGVAPVVSGTACKHSEEDPAPIGTPTISDLSWRPYELITSTTDKNVRNLLTKASDIQMTGMLIYYILSDGKHPFGTSDSRCQKNIQEGSPEFGPRPSDIESRDLIRYMIKRMPLQRPSIQEVAKHPYLWTVVRRFQFLVDVAKKIEFYTWKPTKIAEALHDSCIEARDWTFNIRPEILLFISNWMHKSYTNNYAHLLHFILSTNDNFEIMPQDLKSYIGHPPLFFSRLFPTFFMSVYSVIRDYPFVQQQMALQAYF